MNETKICSCGGEMVSGGRKYIGLADSILLSNSIAFQNKVEIFICNKCRKMEFYLPETAVSEPEESEEDRLYSKYKDVSSEKLKKILDSRSYTGQCKEVVRKILFEREHGTEY